MPGSRNSSTARTTTFKISPACIEIRETMILFRMPWRGAPEVYWIVPMRYVESMKLLRDGCWRVKLLQAYFEVPTNPEGWQRYWSWHT